MTGYHQAVVIDWLPVVTTDSNRVDLFTSCFEFSGYPPDSIQLTQQLTSKLLDSKFLGLKSSIKIIEEEVKRRLVDSLLFSIVKTNASLVDKV